MIKIYSNRVRCSVQLVFAKNVNPFPLPDVMEE
jgi:hypothetical protein